MTDFAVLRAPSQVLFGAGMAAAAGPLAAGHGRRVMVVTDPTIAGTEGFATVQEALGEAALEVILFAEAAVDAPMPTIDAAVALGREREPDVIVAVGGGSVIDLAQGPGPLRSPPRPLSAYYPVQSVPGPVRPLIALPTTAGTGSEATPVSVITDAATGMNGRVASPPLIPRHAACHPLPTPRAVRSPPRPPPPPRPRRPPRTPASTRSRTPWRPSWPLARPPPPLSCSD